MSERKRDKLIRRICSRPPEADFTDVQQLLEIEGFEFRGGKGSHCVFSRPDGKRVTLPTKHGRKVSRVYLDDICKQLNLDEV